MASDAALTKSAEREPTEVAYRGCLFVTGIGSFVAFTVFLALTIWQIIAQGATGLLIASAVMFGLFALAGLGLFGWAWRKRDASPEAVSFRDNHQRGTLRVARRMGGVVTVADIGVETTMSVDEAERVLDDFARRGIAELRVRDDGTHQYVFPSFADGNLDAIPADDPLAEQIEALAGASSDTDVVLDIDDDETTDDRDDSAKRREDVTDDQTVEATSRK